MKTVLQRPLTLCKDWFLAARLRSFVQAELVLPLLRLGRLEISLVGYPVQDSDSDVALT